MISIDLKRLTVDKTRGSWALEDMVAVFSVAGAAWAFREAFWNVMAGKMIRRKDIMDEFNEMDSFVVIS